MQELSNTIAGKYDEIVEKIKGFSNEYLNEEYMNMCIKATKTLCVQHEDDLKKGKSLSWAAGIVHALGSVNNLFDSKDEPYVKALDLYKAFEVSSSTGLNKSKEVKKLLNISEDNSEWILENKQVSSAEEEAAVDTVEEVKTEAETTKAKKSDFTFQIEADYIRAQRIVNAAWRQKNYKNKAKLAKEALDVYENCADAYIILSKDVKLNDEERREMLQKAVNAAKNALKIDKLEDADSRLFRIRESEPLFGSKYTLSMQLWKMGRRDEAIAEASDILEYSVNDSLMVRVILSSWLLIEGHYDRAEEVLNKYENDPLVAVSYNRAFLYYKTGRVRDAEKALRKAYIRNKFVIPYIAKQKRVTDSVLNSSKFGREEEAAQYANIGIEMWNDEDVIRWVKEKKVDFDIERMH